MRGLEPVSSPNHPTSPVVVTPVPPATTPKVSPPFAQEDKAPVDTMAPTKAAVFETATLGPLVRVGDWTDWHRGMWIPQLKDAAVTAGVTLKLEVVEDHWWRGTTYRIVITGPKEAIERYARWYQRTLDRVDNETST